MSRDMPLRNGESPELFAWWFSQHNNVSKIPRLKNEGSLTNSVSGSRFTKCEPLEGKSDLRGKSAGATKCVPLKVERKLYSAYLFVGLTTVNCTFVFSLSR
jgi:hypothetical protein